MSCTEEDNSSPQITWKMLLEPYTTRSWYYLQNIIILGVIWIWSGVLFFISIATFLYTFARIALFGERKKLPAPKTIFITGATSGLGENLAYYYARNGASTIFLCDIDGTRHQGVVDTLLSLNPSINAIPVIANVTDISAIRTVIEQADNQFALDLIIANAGVAPDTAPSHLSIEETMRLVYEVNVLGVVNTVFPAIDRFKLRKQGQIIIVSSLAGVGHFSASKPYSSSKNAVLGLGLNLRQELAPYGIRVTTVCPGFIRTKITAQALSVRGGKLPMLWEVAPAVRVIAESAGNDIPLVTFPLGMTIVTYMMRVLPPQMLNYLSKITNKSLEEERAENKLD